jgi:hypothetical protein
MSLSQRTALGFLCPAERPLLELALGECRELCCYSLLSLARTTVNGSSISNYNRSNAIDQNYINWGLLRTVNQNNISGWGG